MKHISFPFSVYSYYVSVCSVFYFCVFFSALSVFLLFAFLQGEKMVLVACGWRHTITVSSSGSLYTYGWSKYGQLGHGDFEDHLVPHKVDALKDSSTSQVLANTSNVLKKVQSICSFLAMGY